jgi:methanethiol S-methyltransferase
MSLEYRLILVAILWVVWCILHSVLIREAIALRIGLRNPTIGRYYRFLYSVFALVTVVALLEVTTRWHDVRLWSWNGPLRAVQVLLLVLGFANGYLSFRLFNVWHFLGLTAFGIGRRPSDSDNHLITYGIYGFIRHPQFSAVLVLLWARDITETWLVINAILTLYLIIGSRIEEMRCIAAFGDEYRRYMTEVPRFVPRKVPRIRDLLRKRQCWPKAKE